MGDWAADGDRDGRCGYITHIDREKLSVSLEYVYGKWDAPCSAVTVRLSGDFADAWVAHGNALWREAAREGDWSERVTNLGEWKLRRAEEIAAWAAWASQAASFGFSPASLLRGETSEYARHAARHEAKLTDPASSSAAKCCAATDAKECRLRVEILKFLASPLSNTAEES